MSELSGSCSLIIRGEGLDKYNIDSSLKIIHTGFVVKGETIKYVKISAPNDVWMYEMIIQEGETPSEVLD